MANIGNNLNVRPINSTSVNDTPSSQQGRGEYTYDQQQRFEKALNCVKKNIERSDRNGRAWDAPCSEINLLAVAHSTIWGAINGASFAAAETSRAKQSPQTIAASSITAAIVGAIGGFGQAVTTPGNVTSVDPRDNFDANPFQRQDQGVSKLP